MFGNGITWHGNRIMSVIILGKKHKIKIGTCFYSSACLQGTVSSYSNAIYAIYRKLNYVFPSLELPSVLSKDTASGAWSSLQQVFS